MQFQEQQKILGALLKKPENALCADCSSKSPCWASLDFGVFVCMNCSGAHRALSQSVTRIKSIKLDTWTKEWVWHMQLNNKIINQYFEANLNPVLHKKPNPNSTLNEIKKFVYDKYVKRLYAISGEDDPITNLKNGKSPLKVTVQVQKKKVPVVKQITPTIQVKTANKQKNLLDDVSDASNRVPSVSNQKIRQQINLFDDINDLSDSSTNTNKLHVGQHTNLYNKNHYNSFSGKGASHSSTGAVNFVDIFGGHPHQHSSNNNVSFEQFNQLKNYPEPLSPAYIPNQMHHYGHIHEHHYPHMNIYTTGTGSAHNSHNQHHHIPNQPTHITMNINMNMYSNVTNINLHDNPLSTPTQTSQHQNQGFSGITLDTNSNSNSNSNSKNNGLNGLTINDHIKLDINDFVLNKEEKTSKNITNKQKSWVDEWK